MYLMFTIRQLCISVFGLSVSMLQSVVVNNLSDLIVLQELIKF